MDPLLLMGCVAAVVCVATLVYAFWPTRHAKSDKIDQRLQARDADKGEGAPAKAARQSRPQLVEALRRAAPKIAPPTSDEEQSRLKLRLASAGIRSGTAPVIFLACKTVLGLVVGLLTAVLTWQAHHPPINIFGLMAGLGMMAFMLPNLWLSLTIGDRAKKIKKGLADALDLMVIMIEAGLGMDAALQRVGIEMEEAYPELSEEFRIANAEMNMGLKRSEALQNLAERTALKELQSLVATIIQAERFGTSVGKTLRIQSDMLRTKRQQAAEEAAQKTAVKLLIPLVLFIFPSLMVVVGGPAMISLMETLGPGS